MEAFNLFEQLIQSINEQVTSALANGRVVIVNEQNVKEAKEKKTDLSKVQTGRQQGGTSQERGSAAAARAAGENVSRQKPETFKRTEKKVGRNEPCPCGSGKKYKHCHAKK